MISIYEQKWTILLCGLGQTRGTWREEIARFNFWYPCIILNACVTQPQPITFIINGSAFIKFKLIFQPDIVWDADDPLDHTNHPPQSEPQNPINIGNVYVRFNAILVQMWLNTSQQPPLSYERCLCLRFGTAHNNKIHPNRRSRRILIRAKEIFWQQNESHRIKIILTVQCYLYSTSHSRNSPFLKGVESTRLCLIIAYT